MSPVLAAYLALFFLELAWDGFLTLVNLRRARSASGVPPAFSGVVDEDTRRRSVSYTLTRGRFGLVSSLASSAVLLVIILSGFLGWLDGITGRTPIHPYLRGVLFIAALSAVFWVTSLPLGLYGTFVVEARFGFNKTTPRLLALDTLKSLALSAVIGAPLLTGLFWFMDKAGSLWWVWAFIALSAVQLLMTLIYPVLIAPLFNRFTPLPEGSLRERILALAASLGFRTRGIFVMDGSRRSGHSNAYFTGIGSAKRIVLFDTLVRSMTEDEVLSVLAHEIGHEKKGHMRRGLAVSLAVSLAGLWILSLLLDWRPLYEAFGIGTPSAHALLALAAFCSGPVLYFLSPLGSLWSRRHEYQADRYSAEGVGSAKGLKAALLRLTRENLSNLTPHPLYSFWHYSHPTVPERIAALEAWEAGRSR
jgi:STE24 endopeptidase